MTYVKEEVMAHKTGLEDYYVIKNQKKLHFGYTTGSCAAGAAKGATEMLLGGQKQNETDLMTPKGILLHLELHDVCMEKDTVICAVRKDAGDDPDTTNGILVYARVEKCPKSSEITVDRERCRKSDASGTFTESGRSSNQSCAKGHDPESSGGCSRSIPL